jgi:hypothetical protein
MEYSTAKWWTEGGIVGNQCGSEKKVTGRTKLNVLETTTANPKYVTSCK